MVMIHLTTGIMFLKTFNVWLENTEKANVKKLIWKISSF